MGIQGYIVANPEREKLIQAWFDGTHNMQRVMKGRFHTEMRGEPLSMGQLSLLFYIDQHQPVTSKQIAADTHNSRSAVAQLLDGLDQAGLTVREHDPADRRVVHVRLSDAGTAKVRSLTERRKVFFTELAEALTDEELATMITVQRKMIRQLERKQEKE